MTENVVPFKKREPHQAGPAIYLQCKHVWEAVAPVGTQWYECPECHCDKGIPKGMVIPDEGDVFRCNCGSFAYLVSHGCVWCLGCGTITNFEELY